MYIYRDRLNSSTALLMLLEETYSCGKSKFQIVRTKGVVLDGGVDDLVEEGGISEEVFCHAKPEAEELGTRQQRTPASR